MRKAYLLPNALLTNLYEVTIMGQGFYSQPTNNYPSLFNGTVINAFCMYDVENLAVINEGSNKEYVEFKNSWTCFSAPSLVLVGYALPNTPSGQYNLALWILSFNPEEIGRPIGWEYQTMECNGEYVMIGTIPGGLQAQLDSFEECGDQICINWTIPSSTTETAGVYAALDVFPPDGSDYQGPPETAY